jgi:hypothetical protein
MITLPNGVRLLTQAVSGVRTAAVGVYIGTGSRYETAVENGAAHFLEHMAFKSTLNRSTRDIARQIDSLGGHVNAYTTKETTCFYARCLDSHLARTVDLLSDMLLCPAFLQEEVDTERGVILEEIGMYRGYSYAILINGNTASAAELMAAVFRDYSLGTVIGEKSYGKGSVQGLYSLADIGLEGGLRVTTKMYFPPCGEGYNGMGITPDISVAFPEGKHLGMVTESEDTQLMCAIENVLKTSK